MSGRPSPELSVVCRSCGSEVSPYVTECPYCGTRLRKRAPKLERHGDELAPKQTMRDRRRRRAAERRARGPRFTLAGDRPYLTIGAIMAPAIVLVVERASNLGVVDLGAIATSVDDAWWRYLAAPFVYDDLGYLFAIGLALAIFLPGVERRLGLPATAVLVIACGSLGMLAASGLDSAIGEGLPAAGGNGIALGVLGAWLALRDSERRTDPTEEYDQAAIAVAAAVLLLLPLVDEFASPWAGLVGGLVGLFAGLTMALARRRAAR